MTATFLRPDADSSDGSWLNASSSNTDLYASVDESTYDDVDYIRSSIADGDTVRLRLSDPLTGVDAPLTVRYRCKSEGFPAQMYGMLTQTTSTSSSTGGAGLVAYWELEPTSSFATNTYTLSAAEFAKITDFNDLYVSFVSIAQAPHLTGNIDLNFQTGQYYEVGLTAPAVTSYLSCSRASVGYAKTAAGTLTSFGNDTLRITDLGLLVEAARTNVERDSQQITGPFWNLYGTTSLDNQTTAPDGTNTSGKITEDSSSGVSHGIYQSPTAACTAAVWTASIYVKSGGGHNFATFGITDTNNAYAFAVNLTTGAITGDSTSSGTNPFVSSSVELLGNGWLRLILSFNASAVNFYVEVGLSNVGTGNSWAANRAIYNGDGSSALYIWGAQLEAGAFASSYIPTSGGSATRAADSIVPIANLKTLFMGVNGSICLDVLDYKFPESNDRYIGDNAVASNIFGPPSGGASVAACDATITHFISANFVTNSLQTGVKFAVGWDSSPGASIVGDGGAVASMAFTLTFDTSVNLGNNGGSNYMFGYFRRLTLWNSRLADATLQALTAP